MQKIAHFSPAKYAYLRGENNVFTPRKLVSLHPVNNVFTPRKLASFQGVNKRIFDVKNRIIIAFI